MFTYICPGCGNSLSLHKQAVVKARFCNACDTEITWHEIRRQKEAHRRAAEEQAAQEAALQAEQIAAAAQWVEIQEREIAISREQDALRDRESRRRMRERTNAAIAALPFLAIVFVVVATLAAIEAMLVLSFGLGLALAATVLTSPIWGTIAIVVIEAAKPKAAERQEDSAMDEPQDAESRDRRRIHCPQCNARLTISASANRRKIKCVSCRSKFVFSPDCELTKADVVEVSDDYDIRVVLAAAADKERRRKRHAEEAEAARRRHRDMIEHVLAAPLPDPSMPPDRPHPDRQQTLCLDTSDGPMYLYNDGTCETHSISKGTATVEYDPATDELRKEEAK